MKKHWELDLWKAFLADSVSFLPFFIYISHGV